MGELDAGAEYLGEAVELGLAAGGKFDARVLNFFDGGEELLDVGYQLISTGSA